MNVNVNALAVRYSGFVITSINWTGCLFRFTYSLSLVS